MERILPVGVADLRAAQPAAAPPRLGRRASPCSVRRGPRRGGHGNMLMGTKSPASDRPAATSFTLPSVLSSIHVRFTLDSRSFNLLVLFPLLLPLLATDCAAAPWGPLRLRLSSPLTLSKASHRTRTPSTFLSSGRTQRQQICTRSLCAHKHCDFFPAEIPAGALNG